MTFVSSRWTSGFEVPTQEHLMQEVNKVLQRRQEEKRSTFSKYLLVLAFPAENAIYMYIYIYMCLVSESELWITQVRSLHV